MLLKKINTKKVIISIVAILIGIFFIILGEIDDSPGGQLLGLIIVIFGLLNIIKIKK